MFIISLPIKDMVQLTLFFFNTEHDKVTIFLCQITVKDVEIKSSDLDTNLKVQLTAVTRVCPVVS